MKAQNEPYVPTAPPPYPGEGPPLPVGEHYLATDAGPEAQKSHAPSDQPPGGFYPVVPPVSSLNEPSAYPTQPSHYIAGPTTYVTPPTQVTVVQVQQFGPGPIQMTCGKCGATVMTSTKAQTGTLTWIICGGLCLLGCWLGCCLIPFCLDAFQDIDHYCPNCNTKLGTFRRL